jgi:hypothetical protein
MRSILARLHQAAVATSGKQAIIIEQAQSDVYAFYASMHVVVAHLIVGAHFRTTGFCFKISETHFLPFQTECGPSIVRIEVLAVRRNRYVVCLGDLRYFPRWRRL